MSLSTHKGLKIQKSYDKENICSNSNILNEQRPINKQTLKTGVQIRNKLKGKNLFKPIASGKKNQPRKNSHLLQKIHRKIFQQKNMNIKDQQKDECNLSSSSSVRSLKSVTFSLDGSIDEKSISSSNTGNRKKSILKNKLCKDKNLTNFQKQSLASSYCSHLKSVDQAVQNPNSNSIILHKYERLLKQLNLNNQKYTDTIYPPCQQSVFLKSTYTKDFIQKLNAEGYRIKWMRLTQLYPEFQTCLWNPESKSIITKGFIHSSGKQNNYIPSVLNSINKSYMMQKFFENQKISSQGIYYVKMHQTQTNNWKYVIIDDFIPVIVSNRKNQIGKIIKPAFLNVQPQNNIVQLWPFLIQKAFAKYYSTYDSLVKGNTLDFLEQITGDFFTTYSLDLKSQEQSQKKHKIDKLMKNPYNIMLAQTIDGLIYPLRSACSQIQILDIQNNYKVEKIDKVNFENFFAKLHVVQAKKYLVQINCLIKQQHLLQKQKQLYENKRPFILRSFTITQKTHCILALTQKEQKFHRSAKSLKNKTNYTYSWMRMLLVMKQSSGYRWIKGSYEKRKTGKIMTDLEPGQYFVIILPEWSIKPFDLKLTLFTNTDTVIQRKPYQNHFSIIEQSCMDLAQRFGKLTQINNNICSYNYIDYKIGFIIENINNEKTSGQVKILRTIDGLQDYNITPVNRQFQQSKKLQIKIQSLQSYTVVLKVSGGVDKSFLQQFDFGI